jgi:hypothetical protein
MKSILGYLRSYIAELNKTVLVITSVFTAGLIFLNYYYSLDEKIAFEYSLTDQLLFRTITFIIAFGFPYLVYNIVQKKSYFVDLRFVFLFFAGPLIFALKMVIDPTAGFVPGIEENRYWNQVFYWPALCVMTLAILAIIWRVADRDQPFYGVTAKKLNFRPYVTMLVIMLPLIAAASTQPDFLAVYPKLKALNFGLGPMEIEWWHKLFFELSYGTDFITIEVFFRGFLVLAFIKWAGKDAILPMAVFYCTIHFGKPLGECISSYFGGILLGVVVFHTRSILGGLIVHLGIAWMMEVGGFVGNSI